MTVDSSEPTTLRERQARQVRDEIRREFIRLVNERGPTGFSLHDVAAAAGVSDRTLYRYYPNREALIDGVRANENAAMESQLSELRQSVGSLVSTDAIADVFATFDEHAELVRASNLLRQAGVADGGNRERTEQVRAGITANWQIPAEAIDQVVGLVRTLSSSDGWMRMTSPDVGLDSREAGHAVQWALELLLTAAAEVDGPLRPEQKGDSR